MNFLLYMDPSQIDVIDNLSGTNETVVLVAVFFSGWSGLLSRPPKGAEKMMKNVITTYSSMPYSGKGSISWTLVREEERGWGESGDWFGVALMTLYL